MKVMRDEENQKVCSHKNMGNAVEVLEPLVPETMDGISPISVAHVFLEMPSNGSFEASTPKFSIPTYVVMSDQGKVAAQERWIALMRMTPTRLIF